MFLVSEASKLDPIVIDFLEVFTVIPTLIYLYFIVLLYLAHLYFWVFSILYKSFFVHRFSYSVSILRTSDLE